MGFEPAFVGKCEHLVVDTCGVAYSQHVYTAVYQLLAYPVNSHVALRTHQHLTLTGKSLFDCLDKSCCLARAGRSMNNSHVLCPEHFVDGMLLCGIEPWQVYVGEREMCGRLL